MAGVLAEGIRIRPKPTDYDELRSWPLASWIETTFGLATEPESGALVRQQPRQVREYAAPRLAELTGLTVDECETAIQDALLAGSRAKHPETGRPLFAFRLHQFLSKGDSVYVTLEDEQQRQITGQYQVAAPGSPDKPLFPLAFCRECGQEYAVVSRRGQQGEVEFRPRHDRDASGGSLDGYLYISTAQRLARPSDRGGPVAGQLGDALAEIREADAAYQRGHVVRGVQAVRALRG